MNKPSIGRIVHAFVDPRFNNGADVAPALISRVWEERNDGRPQLVNARVLTDGPDVTWVTSIPLYESREAAEADFEGKLPDQQDTGVPQVPFAAFWPPRV